VVHRFGLGFANESLDGGAVAQVCGHHACGLEANQVGRAADPTHVISFFAQVLQEMAADEPSDACDQRTHD
jgi:hypothetical protein